MASLCLARGDIVGEFLCEPVGESFGEPRGV